MPNKTRAELLDETFKAQKNIEDKIWHSVAAYGHRMYRVGLASGKLYDEADAIEEEQKKINAERVSKGLEAINFGRETYKDVGMYDESKTISAEEEQKLEELRESVYKELYGKGGFADIKDAFYKLGVIHAKLYLEFAKEYEEVLKAFPEDTKMREQKAMYVTCQSEVKYRSYNSALQEMAGGFGFLEYINNDEVRDNLWKEFSFEKNANMRLEDYLNMINANKQTRDKYKKDEFDDNDTLYDVFYRKKYKKKPELKTDNEGKIIYDEAVVDDIRGDYVTSVFDDVITANYALYIKAGYNAVKDTLSPKNKKLFEIGKSICNTNVSTPEGDYSIDEGSADKKEAKEFKAWAASESHDGGKTLVTKYSKVFRKNVMDELNVDAYRGSSFNLRTDPRFSDYYKGKISPLITGADPTFINGVLVDLISTGTEGRKKNSDEYEAMLNSLKMYERALSSGNAGLTADYRKELIRDIREYIKDKVGRSIRNPLGQKRYEDAVNLLYELLPEASFRKFIDSVNKAKGVKPGHKKYIDYDKVYGENLATKGEIMSRYYKTRSDSPYRRLRQLGRQKEDTLQSITYNNATDMADKDKANVAVLDGLFGKQVKFSSSYYSAYKHLHESKKPAELADYTKKEYKAISAGSVRDGVSDKDFAAIAFVGALTPGAACLDKRFEKCTASEKAFIAGESYTTDFIFNSSRHKNVEQMRSVEFGRSEADKAFEAYAGGNKRPLAELIGYGVKYLSNKVTTANGIDNSYVCYAEMLTRMKNMLHRDPELLRIAREDGLTFKERKASASILTVADVITKARRAFDDYKKGYGEVKDDVSLESMTDYAMNYAVTLCMRKEKETVDKIPECKNKLFLVDKEADMMRIKGASERECEAYKRGKYAMVESEYQPRPTFVEKLKDPEEYNRFRTEVKKAVKAAKLHRKMPFNFETSNLKDHPFFEKDFSREINKAIDKYMEKPVDRKSFKRKATVNNNKGIAM